MKRTEIFFSALKLPVDALALVLAFIASYRFRDAYTFLSPESLVTVANRLKYDPLLPVTLPFNSYMHYVTFIVPGMLVIFALVGLYAIRATASWPERLMRILLGVTAGEAFILFLFLLKKDLFIPRSTVLYSWVFCCLFVIVGRLLIASIQFLLQRRGVGVIQIGVVGESREADEAASHFDATRTSSYRLALRVTDGPTAEVIGAVHDVHLDELLVASSKYTSADLINLRNACLERGISFRFVPALFTDLPSVFDIQNVNGLPTVEVRPTQLEGWGRVVKRLFDIIVGSLLAVLFLPLFLVIALGLKLTSPGPLFYKHLRIGKNGKPIHIWKFRSMKREFCTGLGYDGDAAFAKLLADNPAFAKEWEETHKLKNDPRISPMGNFIRKTSLDELPQFFNVIGGSLSLVGPRPIVQDEVRKYGEASKVLFSVRPGVTGLWQVSGRNDTTYHERITLDTEYIERWSLLGDISILAKTAWVLLKKGAY